MEMWQQQRQCNRQRCLRLLSVLLFTIFVFFVAAANICTAAKTKNATQPATTKKFSFRVLSNELIQHVNSQPNRTWTAGENLGLKGLSMTGIRRLLGQIEPKNRSTLSIYRTRGPSIKNPLADTPLPVAFDARQQWPQCQSIGDIRDQGDCGSCWAVSTASVITDRVCIGGNNNKNPYISAQDVLSCSGSGGCNGGMLDRAFNYWNNSGIVSGGSYNSADGCKPYSIPPCGHYATGTLKGCTEQPVAATPKCQKTCQDGSSYTATAGGSGNGRFKAREVYFLGFSVADIQRDIMNNGPAAAAFLVYADFVSYKSGVYQHVTGKYLGGHAVKVFGWGVENNVNFWWVANSWNTAWGDNGFFKIIRGTNEGGFESGMLTGLPAAPLTSAAAIAASPPITTPSSTKPKKIKIKNVLKKN